MKVQQLRFIFSLTLTLAQSFAFPHLAWAERISQKYTYSEAYDSQVKMNLRQLEVLQASKGSCAPKDHCPRSLGRLQEEDYSSKLLILDSQAESCMMNVDPKARGAENFNQFPSARDLQNYLSKNYFPELGSFNHEAIRSCQSSNDGSDRYRTAKFYYDLKRLNEGATNIVDELAGIDALLGDGDGDAFRCEGSLTLPQATVRCDQLKKCPKTKGTLNEVAAESEKVEAKYQDIQKRLDEIDKVCLKDAAAVHNAESEINHGRTGTSKVCDTYNSPLAGPRSICQTYTEQDLIRVRACEKERPLLSIAETALSAQYPWFRNKNFWPLRKTKSSSDAIKQVSIQNRNALKNRYEEFFNAGECLNGLADISKRQDCSNDTIRKALEKAPRLNPAMSFPKNERGKYISASAYVGAQACIDQGVQDQKEAASVISSAGRDAGLGVLGVVLTGGLVNAGRLVLTLRGMKTAENVAALTKAAESAGQALNLGLNHLNLATEVASVFQECQDKLKNIELGQVSDKKANPNQCPNYKSAQAQAERDYSSCLSASALLRVGGALAPYAVPAIVKKATAIKNTIAARVAGKETSDAERAAGSAAGTERRARPATERRAHVKDLEPMKHEKIEELDMPSSSDGLKVYRNRRENGEYFETYEYVVDVPGKGPTIVTAELPRDPLTGAIDGNLPAGRKYLDLVVQSSQGKAHVAFLDVGNLGFVNRNFKSGMKGGDEYLKQVAKLIKSVGGNKVTIVKLGGDEFGIVIHEADPAKAKALMQKLSDEISSKDIHQVFRDEKIVQAADFREKFYEKYPDADPRKYEKELHDAFTDEERELIEKRHRQSESAMENSDDYKQALRAADLGDKSDTMKAINDTRLRNGRQDMKDSPDFIENVTKPGNSFRTDFVPYSKETASIGITKVGPGDTTEAVLARAENAATPGKIDGKVAMNQDATKQGGAAQDKTIDDTTKKLNRIAKPNQRAIVADPVPAPKGGDAGTPLMKIDPSYRRMTETEGHEIGRYKQFSVVETTDELGNTKTTLKKYVTLPDGTRKHIDYEVARNAKTGLLDGNTEHAKEFMNAIVSEKPNTTILLGNADELGKINYFKNKSADGDRYIEAVAKAIKSVTREGDIAFKVKGSEFLIEVENLNGHALEAVKNRIQRAIKDSPEIQKIFQDQQKFLEKQLAKNPSSVDIKTQLENLDKMRRDIDLSSTTTQTGDTLDSVLSRLRERNKISRDAKTPKSQD